MSQRSSVFRSPAYGWVIVVLAALAMVATLPGRTHGLGMITERILKDSSFQDDRNAFGYFKVTPSPVNDTSNTPPFDRQVFGYFNFWGTLIGAAFCFPAGWMLDRYGIRPTLPLVVGALGLVVIAMASTTSLFQFAILIALTRGLGQSALSVVSISMIGKWFRSNLPLATGVYSILVSVGFTSAFIWGRGQSGIDWRAQWQQLGAILFLGLTPIFAIFVRSAPDDEQHESPAEGLCDQSDFSLSEALATPAFWMFGFATSFYGLVSSGVSLFNESLLVERGFEKTAFYDLGMMTTAIGLASNLLTGWIATRVRIATLTAIAMSLLAAALLGLPFVRTYPGLVTYAVAMGCAGGMVTVLFFTIWARLFGRAHLGRIQGMAQMMTVVASALGPVVLAEVKVRTGTYLPAIVFLGFVASVLAVTIAIVPVPRKKSELMTNVDFEPMTAT